ncbi:MAG: AraC family transcriptional regulator [Ferruginibacter sp.]
MRLYIKNLYEDEQKKWLLDEMENLGILHDKNIKLCEVSLHALIPQDKLSTLKEMLAGKGLEIVYDRKEILAEQVKCLVHEMMKKDERPEENYSQYISSRLFLNYTYIANVFSETQGITIEHYIINNKIEKAKKLLSFHDYSIGQVADKMGYSSIGHLSNQFKKVTGMSPSEFKKQLQNNPPLNS